MGVARLTGPAEIVTLDSMQVYRGMDVGTATPTAAEQAEVPHHLVDWWIPPRSSRWQKSRPGRGP